MVFRNAGRGDAADAHHAARRDHQHAEDAVVEQAGEATRRVEEVERVPGRRRVDDDEVEAAAVVQLVELLHRHVLLRARERAGDVAVEAVVEDAGGLLVVARVRLHQLVERGLGVEHERVEATTRRGVAVGIPALARDLVRRVRQVLEPERVGEALGRVDGDDDRVATAARALDRERRRGRRLADAAGAAAQDDVPLFDELDSVRSRRLTRSTSSAIAPMPSTSSSASSSISVGPTSAVKK